MTTTDPCRSIFRSCLIWRCWGFWPVKTFTKLTHIILLTKIRKFLPKPHPSKLWFGQLSNTLIGRYRLHIVESHTDTKKPSLETLITSFNVSSDYQGSLPDDISVSVRWLSSIKSDYLHNYPVPFNPLHKTTVRDGSCNENIKPLKYTGTNITKSVCLIWKERFSIIFDHHDFQNYQIKSIAAIFSHTYKNVYWSDKNR